MCAVVEHHGNRMVVRGPVAADGSTVLADYLLVGGNYEKVDGSERPASVLNYGTIAT